MDSLPPRMNAEGAIPNIHPINRIAGEFILRGIDTIKQAHDDKLLPGLIFTSIWHNQHSAGQASLTIRHLARKLRLPYETVRGNVERLVNVGLCSVTPRGLAIPSAAMRSRSLIEVEHKLFLNAERFLVALARIGVTSFTMPSCTTSPGRRLLPMRMMIAVSATGLLLLCIRLLHEYWGKDFTRAIVFTAIWSGNVKHVTNTDLVATQAILPDALRQPISALAISNSLRLPYETVRRHATWLIEHGFCRRAEGGLVVPSSVHCKITPYDLKTYEFVTAFLHDLRRTTP